MKQSLVCLMLVFCVLLIAGCHWQITPDQTVGTIPEYEDNILRSGSGWYGDLPNGLRPIIQVNGKRYRWTGMSKEHYISSSGTVCTIGDDATVLPDGYAAAGKIQSITEDVPSQEMQLRAAFDASGTVYTNPSTPEAVYILMTTSWFENRYIRFVSDELHDNECIYYQGALYQIDPGSDVCETVQVLPEGCVLIGTLKYIGCDRIPANYLETNRIADRYSRSMDGRKVYADPHNNGIIYVYEHHYWAEGDSPAWLVCHIFEE